MDTYIDPMCYLQNIFNEELRQLLGIDSIEVCGQVSQALQVKRKPNKEGDVHIPAFIRQIHTLMKEKTDYKFDGYTIATRLSSSPKLNKYIENINISSNEQLNLCLNKAAVTEAVIKSVILKGNEYGTHEIDSSTASSLIGTTGLTEEYLINGIMSLDDNGSVNGLSSLDHLRIIITLGHVKNLLIANGSTVSISPLVLEEDVIFKLQSTLETRSHFNDTITTRNKLEPCFQRALKCIELSIQKSNYVSKGVSETLSKNTNIHHVQRGVEESKNDSDHQLSLYFDCQQYRKDCNFQNVAITRDLIHRVSLLEFNTRISDKPGDSCQLLHITSSKKVYISQQSSLIWEALSSSPVANKQIYMSLGMINVHNNQQKIQGQVGLEDLLRIRERQLRSAYLLKYGDIVKGAGWDGSIRSVAIATIKLQIMSAAQNNQVRIDISEETQDYRQSIFVMYNCARLAKLFYYYEQGVEQGLYPPLPKVDTIDFSLLREKDEWNLLVRYVMTFPSVVRDSVRGFLAKPRHDSFVTTGINKICCFLLDLSQDFSSYYGRTHVLGESRPHLFPTMFARLYLLKAIQQVLHNGLALLDIQPLTQM